MKPLQDHETFGLLKTHVDVHTLGITTIGNLLRDCGYKVIIANDEVARAVEIVDTLNSSSFISHWIRENNITRLGFSYRLDPQNGFDFFCKLYHQLIENKLLEKDGGPIKHVFFAGLPDTCALIDAFFHDKIVTFPGDEKPVESLSALGVPKEKIPTELSELSEYDKMRWDFAKGLIESAIYRKQKPLDHLGYITAGKQGDSLLNRLEYCIKRNSLPLIRAHVGPYFPNRNEALKVFDSWVKDLAQSKLLDVLSIGTSQLTQSNFEENWEGKPNGGGVPINSRAEYAHIRKTASPMLVRTYAGTKYVPWLAQIHEETLNISWHALSLWWFSEIDGRGENTVLENLNEHAETIRYIASTNKPMEPNVPHHFAFRGTDDISYIISGYVASKFAKRLGIRLLILQDMLNTPKHTTGIEDLAKARVMLKLVRELEDDSFHVLLQTRAGLDYFSPDLEKAKVQLAAVTALMDDIEPNNDNSPEIIHVVSYSEAIRLATPPVIKESIQITLSALREYRIKKKMGLVHNMKYNTLLEDRVQELLDECRESIKIIETSIRNLYSPKGLFTLFKNGFFPVPALYDPLNKFPLATKYKTAIKKGGIRVVDDNGEVLYTPIRYSQIISNLQ